MPVDQSVESPVRVISDADDLAEARLEAAGFIFHGTVPEPEAPRKAVRATTNILHFARCPKIDRGQNDPDLLWFRTIRVAKRHLDEVVGGGRWKWCKHCQQEVTQRLLNE
ncbi:hypothetical protein [Tautonia plasticadhaerens]|uniref:Uncharacterized protein n=1 Tax=Tautonia plasticadhaerens TaxID=2527974 RepID=A0A518H5Q2_9BACT|nr:hypothetical protein [Tautonia plasticadhaerens]QDV36162.1 hypothetical protein ElP_40760 [Tautonia plasticadhaerens]